MKFFATTANISGLDMHCSTALNTSPLQVLHSYLPSGQGGTWPERRYWSRL